MSYYDKQLDELKELASRRITQDKVKEKLVESGAYFEEFFLASFTNPNVKTIALSYDEKTSLVTLQVVQNQLDDTAFINKQYDMTQDAYWQFCDTFLQIKKEHRFNSSANVYYDGVPARVFAIMPPYRVMPLIIISTVKNPPHKIDGLSLATEELLGELVVRGNLLIAGQSGSGKTYLLNYLLNKYLRDSKRRIGIIQEFAEIISPNAFTDQIYVPPRKPDQRYNDLEFLTEQSNLMRYDTLIVGEIKGSEAWPFVINSASGTKCISTIHGIDIQSCLTRLKTLCMLGQENLDGEVVSNFIAQAISYVVLVDQQQVKKIQKIKLTNGASFAAQDLHTKGDLIKYG